MPDFFVRHPTERPTRTLAVSLRRLKTMTKEQRRKAAAKAAKTRWPKHVKKHS